MEERRPLDVILLESALLGIFAMMLGILAAAAFVIGSKYGEHRNVWMATGMALCMACGFTYVMRSMTGSNLND